MDEPATRPAATGVQSVSRAFGLLEAVAAAGGEMAIGQMAAVSGLPLPTIHRLLRTLVDAGYMRQLESRRYALGFRLVPLGLAAQARIGEATAAILEELVAELGETANVAVLSGERAEYIAQHPSPHSMRTFTEIGKRVELHCTGVGKALLAQLDDEDVHELLLRTGLPAHTEHTRTTWRALSADLARTRAQGFALDDQEQELGARCVAVAVSPRLQPPLAISVSGPLLRMTSHVVDRAVPLLTRAAHQLAGAPVSATERSQAGA